MYQGENPSIRTGEEAIAYIHSFSWLGSRPGLSRTGALLDAIGNPEQKLKFVHIVGTNGKGSTAAMLASVLTAAGWRTGLYTSPYIHRFQERMSVDGKEITNEELAAITQMVGRAADSLPEHPTEFELVTGIALEFFCRRGCDIVVLEAGMGGRLDSTNVIPPPEVVVITNVGLDHTAQLGESVEAIAKEKAAVIKRGCPVVLYRQDRSVTDVVEYVCRENASQLNIADPQMLIPLSSDVNGQRLQWKGEEIRLSLLGENQRRNAAVVLKVVEVLRQRGWAISDRAAAAGLAAARWPGRFELVHRRPWVVVDGGHNPQCAQSAAENLERYFPGKKAVFLLGVLADKDYCALWKAVKLCAFTAVTITPPCPRALPAEELAAVLRADGCPAQAAPTIQAGMARAMELAGEDGLVFAFGSLYSVAELRGCFGLA